MNKQIMQDIVSMIDTGSCEDIIIKDLPQYDEVVVRQYIQEMLRLNILADRGAYLVFLHKDQLVNECVYGDGLSGILGQPFGSCG